MTTYKTGNPVGSADPRDLYDNAQVIDDYANSDAATTGDRLGVERATIAGIDAAARAAIANAGYEFAGDYAAGIEITAYNQVVRDTSGEFWRVSGSTALPYTTTGAGMPEGGAFVAVGDAALRQELLDGTATVTSSTGAQTIASALNGRVQRSTKTDHPLSHSDLTLCLKAERGHIGFNPNIYEGADGQTSYLVTRVAPGHNLSGRGVVELFTSTDRFTSINSRSVIYFGLGQDVRPAGGGEMANGRFCYFAAVWEESSSSYLAPIVSVTDNEWATRTTTSLSLGSSLPNNFNSVTYGPLLPYLQSANGPNSWIKYFYSQNTIGYSTTNDNGDTWSPIETAVASPGFSINENAVEILGDTYLMILRGSDNAAFSTSSDMVNWTTPQLSNIYLGFNAPHLRRDNDNRLWFYTTFRDSDTNGVVNAVCVCELTEEFITSGGVSGFTDWTPVAQLPQWGTGYLGFSSNTLAPYALMIGHETNGHTRNDLGAFGASSLYKMDTLSASEAVAVSRYTTDKQNLLTNGNFDVWQHGSSGAGEAGRVTTADAWGLRRTGAATGHYWQRTTSSYGDFALRFGREDANDSTADVNLISVVGVEDLRRVRRKYITLGFSGQFGGGFSGSNVQLRLSYLTQEQDVTSTDGGVAGETIIAVRDYSPSESLHIDKFMTGYLPNDAAQVIFRIRYTPSGVANDDYIDVNRVYLYEGSSPKDWEPESYSAALDRCLRLYSASWGDSMPTSWAFTPGSVWVQVGADNYAYLECRTPVFMRKLPEVYVVSPATGEVGKVENNTTISDQNVSSITPSRTNATVKAPAVESTPGNLMRAHFVFDAQWW